MDSLLPTAFLLHPSREKFGALHSLFFRRSVLPTLGFEALSTGEQEMQKAQLQISLEGTSEHPQPPPPPGKLLSLVQQDVFGCPGRSESQSCSLTHPKPRRRAVQSHAIAQLCWEARAAAALHWLCTWVGVHFLLEHSH